LEVFRNLIVPDGDYDPLLAQISRFACDTSISTDCNDIIYADISSQLGTALSGVYRFLPGANKPKVQDFSNVIIFCVGGITLREVAQMQQIFTLNGKKLLVGSTNICTRDILYSNVI
jgi:hypothetical protein